MPKPQRTTVQIPLVGGLDQKTAPDLVQPGSFLEVENCWRDRTGEFRKRFGSAVLGSSMTNGGTLPAAVGPQFLGKQRNGLFRVDTGRMASLGSGGDAAAYDASAGKWFPLDSAGGDATMLPATICGLQSALDRSLPDAAVTGGLAIVANEKESGSNIVEFSIIDTATGNTASYLWSAFGRRPRCAVAAGYLVAFYEDFTNKLFALVWNSAALSDTPTTYQIATNVTASEPYFDVIPRPGASTILVAYLNNAATITGLEFNPATGATVASATFGGATNADQCMAWAEDLTGSGSYYLITAGSVGGVVVRTLSTAFAVTATQTCDAGATTNVRNLTGYLSGSGSDKRIYWELAASPVYNSSIRFASIVGGVIAASTILRGACLGSKAFRRGSGFNYFVVLTYDSTIQPMHAVAMLGTINITGDRPLLIGKIVPGEGGGRTARQGALPAVTVISGSGTAAATYAVALSRAIAVTTVAGVALQVRNTQLFRLDFANIDLGNTIEVGGDAVCPGGLLKIYDGGFCLYASNHPLLPEALTSTPATGGGALTLLGIYRWAALYKMIDGAGRVHWSAPSAVVASTLTGTQNQSAITVPTLRIDLRAFSVSIVLFRNIASGTVFYKVAEKANDTSADTVSFTDQLADSAITASEYLYTTGGELPNFDAPALSSVVEYKGRIVGIRAEDRCSVWYSKLLRNGVFPGFHPTFTLTFDAFDGDLTALGVLDDKMIFFKRSTIYALSGDGPDDRGVGGFNDPSQVTNSQGTINPRSVLQEPEGLCFEGARGIWQLKRSGELAFIGAPVQAYFSGGGRDITAAVLLSDYSQLRFFTAAGRTFVWDYLQRQWYTFTGQPAGAAVAIGSTIYWAHPTTGVVSYETIGAYGDNGTGYAQRVVPPWLSLAGLAGAERVKRLALIGENVGSHTVKVSTYLNFNESAPAFTPKTLAGASAWPESEWRMDVQRCTSAKFAIEESAANTGAGFRLSAATLDVAVKERLRRMPSANRGT